MAAVTLKDAPADAVITTYAALLKRQGKIQVPAWADLVKTGNFKELAPYNDDWFYVRCASIARHIYIRGGIGVGCLRKIYGGPNRRGTRPTHHAIGSGSVARKCVQALESIKVLEAHPDGGRRVTRIGRRDLDRIAQEVVGSTQDEE